MKSSNYGGKREGAGRPVDVAGKLVEYDVALSLGGLVPRREGVGLRQARNVIRKHGAASVIGAARERDLHKLGETEDGPVFLQIQETKYLAARYELGFDS